MLIVWNERLVEGWEMKPLPFTGMYILFLGRETCFLTSPQEIKERKNKQTEVNSLKEGFLV